MKTSITALSLIGALALALAGCGEKQEPVAATPDTMSPTPSSATAAPADPGAKLGKIKYGSVCAGCHGQQGQGQASFPKLAGQAAEQIASKLRDYKAGKEIGPQSAMMIPTAQALSDEEIDALAKYIANLAR
jgi:cytochrome c553